MKRLFLLALILFAVGSTAPARVGAQAPQYTYTVIRDIGAAVGSVPFAPSINDAGQVAYYYGGELAVGDGTTTTPLFVVTAFSSNDRPGAPNGPVWISNSGRVAFTGITFSWGSTIALAGGDGLTFVAASPTFPVPSDPAINNSDQVAFHSRSMFVNDNSVHVWTNGATTRIAGPGDEVPGGTLWAAMWPRINDVGQVVFHGAYGSTNTNLIRYDNGVFTPIGNGLLGSINNVGEVAFFDVAYQGIAIGAGGPLRYIPKPPAPLRVHSSAASINGHGDVAFEVSSAFGGGGTSVYVGNPEGIRPVIRPTDTIPGLGPVLSANSGNRSLNSHGQVAFLVEYGSAGRYAIVRADPPDTDADDDGVPDDEDAFPNDPGESVDTDSDGLGNNADTDDDNDGQADADETACGSNPLDAGSTSPDTDTDGRPDCVDVNAPPVITVPGTLFAEAASPAGAVVSYVVGVDDPDDPGVVASCVPASGATFPIGTTTVSCTAADGSGGEASAEFAVIVRDTTRPSLFVARPEAVDVIFDEPVLVRVLSNDAVGVASVSARADVLCGADFSNCLATTPSVNLNLTAGTAQSGTWSGHLSSPYLTRLVTYILRVTVADAAGNQFTTAIFVDNDGIAPTIDRARANHSIDQSTVFSQEFNTGTTAGTIHHETGILTVDGMSGSGVRITAHNVRPFLTLPPHGGMCTGRDKQFFLDVSDETLDLTCIGDTVRARAVLALPEVVVRKLQRGQRCEWTPLPRCEDRLYWMYAPLATGYGIRTGSPFEAEPDNPGPIVLEIRRVEDDGSEVTVGTIRLDPGEIASPEFVAGPVSGTELLLVTAQAGTIEVTVGGATQTVSEGQTSSVAVRKAEQAISFAPLPDVAFGHAPIELTALASSGLPVSYSATGACTVSGNMLTLTGVNSCSVTASQAGNDLHHPAASVARSFLVTHSWSGVTRPLDSAETIVATAGSTVPVKFTLTGGSAGVTDLPARLYVSKVGTTSEADAEAAGNRIDGLFRYDPTAGQYVFNWDTKGLSPGTWILRVDLLDGAIRTVIVELQ